MPIKIHERSAIDSILLIPLIDVVFFLLVFFLVTASISEEEERQMQVQLPVASEAKPLTSRPKEVVVNITALGQYFISDEAVTLPRLEQVFEAASAANPGRATVLIRADKRCQWDFIVAAMNACNKAKIRDYRVTTLPVRG